MTTTTTRARAEFARTFYGLESVGKSGRHVASLEAFRRFWTDVRAIDREAGGYTGNNAGILKKKATRNGQGESWLYNTERAMLSMLVGRSSVNDNPIAGRQAIGAARGYHGPDGSERITRDIYRLLKDGRIVILDMSVGNPAIREKLAGTIVREIFRVSSNYFNEGRTPPSIVFYVEEAHNLIGKKAELTEIWPRIAKEGAKYGIALVYATQEPSSVHPNILANTENFFVTHLNNDVEIRALSSFYDFADFGDSLKRSQDVGFARIKTLSANFVTPTQITRFDPSTIKARYSAVQALEGNDWFRPIEDAGASS